MIVKIFVIHLIGKKIIIVLRFKTHIFCNNMLIAGNYATNVNAAGLTSRLCDGSVDRRAAIGIDINLSVDTDVALLMCNSRTICSYLDFILHT